MPIPPAMSATRRRVRRSAVKVPYGPSAKTRVPSRTCCRGWVGGSEGAVRSFGEDSCSFASVLWGGGVVTELLRGVGGLGVGGTGGQREGVRFCPAVPGKKPPQEELPRLGLDAVEVPTGDV